MNICDYYKKKKDSAGLKSCLVKDFSIFDFNHIPAQPLMREECRHLIDEMLRFEMSSIPTHQAVIGSKGSGKTLTLRYLQKLLTDETDLKVLYANCREHNTSFKIFAHLLDVQARGASLSELYNRFCQKYNDKAIIILDEVDLMSPKDKRRDILYFLSRSHNPYQVIMLSNNHRILRDLDASTKSSLQPVTVYFKNYDATQIHEILQERARQGLHSCDDNTLAQIAAMTVKKANGDARIAIKTLFYVVTEEVDNIAACFEKAREDVIIDMLNNLSDPLLMMLRSIVINHSDFAKDIYKKYCQISLSQNEKPFSYMYYYSNLSFLQSMGLIALISTKFGRTYANRVMLTFDEPVLDPIYRLRFG